MPQPGSMTCGVLARGDVDVWWNAGVVLSLAAGRVPGHGARLRHEQNHRDPAGDLYSAKVVAAQLSAHPLASSRSSAAFEAVWDFVCGRLHVRYRRGG